jgi:predicted enzyme related to lactoylglutathione lyase
MYAAPPKVNTVTINSMNCEQLIEFYFELGILFKTEIIDGTIKYYSYVYEEFTFEIREVTNSEEITKNITLQFQIDEIDGYIDDLKKMGIKIVKDPWKTETHQYIHLNDPDGNLIVLMTEI